MASTQKAGFEIAGRFYPWPESFRLGDPVLITELTGLEFSEFAEALDDDERGLNDPVILLGVVGAAIWQANPRWTRERAARHVQGIPQNQFSYVAGAAGEEDESADPPAEAPSGAGTPTTEEPATA